MFHRVAAHCARGEYCPGGLYARPGWSDATLCDGAPVYQRAEGGPVLFRFSFTGGAVRWAVGPSSCVVGSREADIDIGVLETCTQGYFYYTSRARLTSQSLLLPPDAAGYGWSDPGGYDCNCMASAIPEECDGVKDSDRRLQGASRIVAGGGGGGGR